MPDAVPMHYATPDLSHLSRKDYERDVYEPAEDTFLLLDALEAEAPRLLAAQPRICLEIGSGSGCVTAFLGSILGATTSAFIATDINEFAAHASIRTGRQNNVCIDAVCTSLGDGLLLRLARTVDVLIFNPPYVPTTDEEQVSAAEGASLAGAWAGGADGMVVTNRLLPVVKALLSEKGVFYLVAVPQNRPDEIKRRMQDEHGLAGTTVLHRRAGREHLHVLRFERRVSA